MNIINTSFLDDLPSYISHRSTQQSNFPTEDDRSISITRNRRNRSSGKQFDFGANRHSLSSSLKQPLKQPAHHHSLHFGNSYSSNPTHQRNMNTSQVEIKEYLDYINMMIPNDNQQQNRNMNDSRNTLTFMSATLENDDHSYHSMQSEMSSLLNMNSIIHSRILKTETGTGGLQVVAETENEPSGFMLDGLDTEEDDSSEIREKNISSEEDSSHENNTEKNKPERIKYGFQSSKPPGLDPIVCQADSPKDSKPKFNQEVRGRDNSDTPTYHKKSLSMDVMVQTKFRYKAKTKLDRAGSAALDLEKLKLFVDDEENSQSSDQNND